MPKGEQIYINSFALFKTSTCDKLFFVEYRHLTHESLQLPVVSIHVVPQTSIFFHYDVVFVAIIPSVARLTATPITVVVRATVCPLEHT